MSPYFILYHSLLLAALLLSIYLVRSGKTAMRYLAWLFFVTLVVELTAEYCLQKNRAFVWLYHLFVVVEYGLLGAYFLHTGGTQRRRWVRYSIPVFAIISLAVSVLLYRMRGFPGLNLNLSGALLFVMYTHLLFNLDGTHTLPVLRHPNFWIAIGILLFYGGTFFFHGIFTPLLHLNAERANALYGLINQPLNLILYGCFITGLLCSLPNKKYFTR